MVLEVILEFASLAVKEVALGLPLAHQPCLQGQFLEALEVTFPSYVTINLQQKYESFSGKNALSDTNTFASRIKRIIKTIGI